MSNKMWESTVEHAKTCVLSGKLYVYYSDETRSTGVVFNHIYELRGLIANGQFLSVESLSHDQKVWCCFLSMILSIKPTSNGLVIMFSFFLVFVSFVNYFLFIFILYAIFKL